VCPYLPVQFLDQGSPPGRFRVRTLFFSFQVCSAESVGPALFLFRVFFGSLEHIDFSPGRVLDFFLFVPFLRLRRRLDVTPGCPLSLLNGTVQSFYGVVLLFRVFYCCLICFVSELQFFFERRTLQVMPVNSQLLS